MSARLFRVAAYCALAGLVSSGFVGGAGATSRGSRRPELRRELRSAGQIPGCHAGQHRLSYHGGDLVQNAKIFVLFWGSQWQSDPEHQATLTDLRKMLQQIGTSGYECTLREFELPEQPIGPASYVGDYIIPAAPVPPGGQLSDATLRARIKSEIVAGHAPPPDDDTIYLVVPPKGVPIAASGETGCGGSNFVFCGYHDAFTSGTDRIRYAALPYPCNSGGFTCFVGDTDDPGAALQSVASHEMAETISDPDDGPTGAAAWYEDATGEENADICDRNACNTDLTIGMDSFVVNSLWSNLADGCVFHTACSTPAPHCTDGAPGTCIATSATSQGCALEWLVAPNLAFAPGGTLPSAKVACADGQPFCDADGEVDGKCTFRVASCLNNHDPRLACTPTSVSRVRLGSRLRASSDPSDQANAAVLADALAAIDPGSTGLVANGRITYTPAAATGDSCTGYVDVVVPASSHRRYSLTVRTPSGSASQRLQLTCGAAFP